MLPVSIAEFIKEQQAATVCCTNGEAPYCFNCFYALMEEEGYLVYKSAPATQHEKLLREHPRTAGTIIPEHIAVSVIRGVQFEGLVLEDDFALSMRASVAYYLRFPFAVAVPGTIRIIELKSVKFTDNTRGFGHKEHWKR